jgi:hypothetical protein
MFCCCEQAAHSDFVDASTTRNLVKKSPVLPAGVLKEHPSLTFCEDQVQFKFGLLELQNNTILVLNRSKFGTRKTYPT